jgi:hypothetical protein
MNPFDPDALPREWAARIIDQRDTYCASADKPYYGLYGGRADLLSFARALIEQSGAVEALEALRPITIGSRRADNYATTHKRVREESDDTMRIDAALTALRAVEGKP